MNTSVIVRTQVKNMATHENKKTSPKPSTLRIGTRYRSNRLNGPYDAIVIGSGIGGLTTAACLSKAGKKVLVLEQHYTAGGFTHSYARNGYEWDVGVHYIGDVGSKRSMARKVFDFVSDGALEWAPMDANYDRFYFGEDQYDLIAGKSQFVASLSERFPEERDALEKYLELLNKVANVMPLNSLEKFLPDMLSGTVNFVKRKALPDFLTQTTYEVLRTLTQNEHLITVLTGQWGDCGLPPRESSFIIHALIAKHYIYGGYYPVGGASRMAETIIPVIQQSGGEVFTYANVTEILVQNGRASGVRMADGTDIPCTTVISNAGVFNTFQHLLPEPLARKSGYLDKLTKVKPSMAHLGMYIGLKGTAEELGLPKTNFWIYPNYQPEQNIQRFFNDRTAPFPVVYISFPSAKDPSWSRRYPGRSTIEIVAPGPYDWFEKWRDETWGKRGEDYDALKNEFSERLLEVLYEKLPQLRGKIDYFETSTPLSTDFFCAYKRGEIYGLDHDPSRFQQTWLKPKTRIPGLYLTGQDILSCGVVGAMLAGVGTSFSVLGWQSYKLVQAMRQAASQPARPESAPA